MGVSDVSQDQGGDSLTALQNDLEHALASARATPRGQVGEPFIQLCRLYFEQIEEALRRVSR